jgi:hypothetical protein
VWFREKSIVVIFLDFHARIYTRRCQVPPEDANLDNGLDPAMKEELDRFCELRSELNVLDSWNMD